MRILQISTYIIDMIYSSIIEVDIRNVLFKKIQLLNMTVKQLFD